MFVLSTLPEFLVGLYFAEEIMKLSLCEELEYALSPDKGLNQKHHLVRVL